MQLKLKIVFIALTFSASIMCNAQDQFSVQNKKETWFKLKNNLSKTDAKNKFASLAKADLIGPLALQGDNNTLYGQNAGAIITTGSYNSFFGASAGSANSSGYQNSFFGFSAGIANDTGYGNAFFGDSAGIYNVDGQFNTFIGSQTGYQNSSSANTFVGYVAGANNYTGFANSSFGVNAGWTNASGNYNTFLGSFTDSDDNLTNATAVGAFATVTSSNSLVLGSINGINSADSDAFVGIGTTNPDRQFVIEGDQAMMRFRRYYSGAIYAPAVLFEKARGTRSAPEDIQAGDYLGKFQFRGMVAGDVPEYGLFAFIATDLQQNGRFAFIDRDMTTERVSILNTGNVGIGTTTPQEKLDVVGNIKVSGSIYYNALQEVPDFVFDPNYKLMPIDQLKSFYVAEKHLPNIPSAEEVKQQGINLSEFQMKLLQKIEELTLYIVDQSEEIDHKKAEIAKLSSQNSEFEKRLSVLERFLQEEKSR